MAVGPSGLKPANDPVGLGQIGALTNADVLKKGNAAGAAEFKKALERAATTRTPGAPAQLDKPADITGASALKFSNHAVERMRSRGINFGPDEMRRIEGAVSKAAAKGSKDSLILSGDNALIVSVKNNTVVTVMDRAAMKENVFTNIDSTVVL